MKNIITGKNRPAIYAFENAVQIIGEKLRAGDTKIYMATELGHILIEVDPSILNVGGHPLNVYPWGNEPKTRLTCEYRHREVNFYAKVKFPAALRRHTTQAMTLAIMIMGATFMIKIIDQRNIYNRTTFQDYLDAIVHAWSETTHTFENNPMVHTIVELENRKDLYALNSNVRRVTYELVNEISRQRTAAAEELITKSEQEILEDTKEDPITVDRLSKFWTMMLCIGQRARKDEYRWNFVRENTTVGYQLFTKEHPDLTLTPCQIVVCILTTNKFSAKKEPEKKEQEDERDAIIKRMLYDILATMYQNVEMAEKYDTDPERLARFLDQVEDVKKSICDAGFDVPTKEELRDMDLLTYRGGDSSKIKESNIPGSQVIEDDEDDEEDAD